MGWDGIAWDGMGKKYWMVSADGLAETKWNHAGKEAKCSLIKCSYCNLRFHYPRKGEKQS